MNKSTEPAALDSSALGSLMEAFLAKGGAIHEVPMGASASPDAKPLTFAKSDEFTSGERAENSFKRRAAIAKKAIEDDSSLVKRIIELKDVQHTFALSKALGISGAKLQRLLSEYLADDATLDRFRATDRESQKANYEADLLAKVRQALADGMAGIRAIAVHCGAPQERVSQINRKYDLKIKRRNTPTEVAE